MFNFIAGDITQDVVSFNFILSPDKSTEDFAERFGDIVQTNSDAKQ